jgi:uncharacterized protein (UPF0335 family)
VAHTSDRKERPNSIKLPADDTEALAFVVNRISKLMSDRKMTADQIIEVKRAARNDGFANETIALSVKFAKLSPEKRTAYVDRISDAIGLYAFDKIGVRDGDDISARAKLQRSHVQKILHLQRDKAEISGDIREMYAAAKDAGIDVPTLKQIMKLQKMDPDDRDEWFARVDNMGARLKFWSI